MKIAMLTTVGDRCGIAAYTRDLIHALDPLVELTVVPIEPGKQPLEELQSQAELLNAADVVHIQHEHSFWGGILPNRSAFWNLRYMIKKPVVITAHTTTSLADLLRLKEERRLPHRIAKSLLVLRRGYRDSVEIAPFITGRCIVHTQEGRDALTSRGANPKYTHVIPAGIPAPLDLEDEDDAEFPVKSGRIITLFGYIAPNKGYEVAMDALAALPEDVRLVIAGGVRSEDMETYAASLRSRIRAQNLDGRVVITGFLTEEQLARIMRRSDLVIAPHTYATGSYSITVPLSYGKAIIASDQACFVEIVREAGALEIAATGNSAALAERIEAVLNGPEIRSVLEARARKYAADRTWASVAERTVQVYQEALLDVDRLSHHRPYGAR